MLNSSDRGRCCDIRHRSNWWRRSRICSFIRMSQFPEFVPSVDGKKDWSD